MMKAAERSIGLLVDETHTIDPFGYATAHLAPDIDSV
jgi:hypothetical protein